MASTDATALQVRNQAFRAVGVMLNNSTGAFITAGLTGLAVSVSKDTGAFTAATATPTEAPASSGEFYIDLTAEEMNAAVIVLKCTATNANAWCPPIIIYTFDLRETFTGHWLAQTVKKIEQGWIQACGYLVSKVKRNKNSGLITAYHRGTFSGGVETEGALIGTMDYSDDGTDVVKGTIEAP